jgi:hypothetical protein
MFVTPDSWEIRMDYAVKCRRLRMSHMRDPPDLHEHHRLPIKGADHR